MTHSESRDLENDKYHADTSAISKSGISKILDSPFHYYSHYLDPVRPVDEGTAATKKGSAFHCALFEADEFDFRYTVLQKSDTLKMLDTAEDYKNFCAKKNVEFKKSWTKDELRKAIEAKHPTAPFYSDYLKEINESNLDILTEKDYKDVIGMRDSAFRNPVVKRFLSMAGKVERRRDAICPITGVKLKTKPDFDLSEICGVMLDGKSCSDASNDKISRDSATYGYEIQAPFYMDVQNLIEPNTAEWFIFIFVENTFPFAVNLKYVDATTAAYQLGKARYSKGIELYAKCKERNEWPGYEGFDWDGKIDPLVLPPYASKFPI